MAIKTRAIGTGTVQTVNGRDLHKTLELKKDFTSWMKQQIKRADLVKNKDYIVFLLKVVNPQGGRPSDEYHLTIEAGKNIAMLSESPKGKEVRAYFIECERKVLAPAAHSPAQMLVIMADRKSVV